MLAPKLALSAIMSNIMLRSSICEKSDMAAAPRHTLAAQTAHTSSIRRVRLGGGSPKVEALPGLLRFRVGCTDPRMGVEHAS
jgi:hypothetical protein